jgi:nitrogen fixation NifU-like protein
MTGAGDLARLYRDKVLDHSRNPRNFHRLEDAQARAEGHNPLCGDRLVVYLRFEGERIGAAAFEGTGCAISLASASMMTEIVRGRSRAEAREAAHAATAMLAPDGSYAAVPGDLAALGGVRGYPSRVRCALLPWRTLEAALDGRVATTTEQET